MYKVPSSVIAPLCSPPKLISLTFLPSISPAPITSFTSIALFAILIFSTLSVYPCIAAFIDQSPFCKYRIAFPFLSVTTSFSSSFPVHLMVAPKIGLSDVSCTNIFTR